MFPFIKEENRLAVSHAETRVISVSVSKAKASMDLTLCLTKPASQNDLQAIKDMISDEFGLADVNLITQQATVTSNPESGSSEIPQVHPDHSSGDTSTAANPHNPAPNPNNITDHPGGSPENQPASKSLSQTKTSPTRTKRTTSTKKSSNVIMGRETKAKPIPIEDVTIDHGKVTVSGDVCSVRSRHIEKSNSWMLNFDITDYTGTVNVTKFLRDTDGSNSRFAKSPHEKTANAIKEGMTLTVSGTLYISNFDQQLTLEPKNIFICEKEIKQDTAPQKRVELHLHTQMSAMDGLTDIEAAISRAVDWGHKAIAITDHGVVQAFPAAAAATSWKFKDKIKVIYGIEGYMRDDREDNPNDTQINANPQPAKKKKRTRTNHVILLAKNKTGLKNLYKLVSISHIHHLEKVGKRQRPIIPKSLLQQHREGLIIGSACEAGELFSAIVKRQTDEELHKIADFYDYLEIQPISNNFFMLKSDKSLASNEDELRDFNRKVVEIGQALDKPVVATGDVHYLDPEHEVYRHIILTENGFSGATDDLPLHFRTTDEMLNEFSYLGEAKAFEVVVTNTQAIADLCTLESPLPDKSKLFPPKLDGSADELKQLVYGRLTELYGENPQDLITQRLEKELNDILSSNYDVIYMLAQKIATRALSEGSIVGSRGSIGSSFVAYLAGITDVNALQAHYRCPSCKNTEFHFEAFATNNSANGEKVQHQYNCGADMPDKPCSACGTMYVKEGFNAPFETFLGFDGEKIPDIDLNFSGDYQALAHKHTTELCGEEFVFRAGTISTVKDKIAYGYVRKYLDKNEKQASNAEIYRLARGCVGVKTTTGQHPGGLVIIPRGMEITDFCPAQLPADDKEKGVITTHFDYGCLEDNLIKLDALGHDNPTMIKALKDLTGIDPRTITFDDPDTMSIFVSPKKLGLPIDDPIIGRTGAIGIPEFGTPLSRQMLTDTNPGDFDTLIKLSGYSHGTNVWIGNAKDLIEQGKEISETIGCRDDIMNHLVEKGMEDRKAFKISESVRKGKGIPKGMIDDMLDIDVPQWYIDSCQMITYLFPKAHAIAYVMEAFIIAWFKVHKPLAFYSTHFYRRSNKGRFDASCMARGIDVVRAKIREINNMPIKSKKEEDLMVTLESVYEFYMRGFEFANIDLYKSDSSKFTIVDDNKLRPPFTSISGLGETAANNIVKNREGYKFISIDDISATCPGVNKSNIEELKAFGALGNLPETSQITFF